VKGGGQSQRCEVRGAEGAIGVECGEGCPSPLKKGSGKGTVPPPQKFLKFFGVQCVQKIFVFRPKGGGHRPVAPLNTPLPIARHTPRSMIHDCRRLVALIKISS